MNSGFAQECLSAGGVCAVVLLDSSGRALLQLRDERPGLRAAGQWVFPGGHVEPGEALAAGARREFVEETAYRCGPLFWVLSLQDVHYPGWPAYPLHVFFCDYDGIQKVECREGQELRFIRRSEAEAMAMPDYQKKIWDFVILFRQAQVLRQPSSTAC